MFSEQAIVIEVKTNYSAYCKDIMNKCIWLFILYVLKCGPKHVAVFNNYVLLDTNFLFYSIVNAVGSHLNIFLLE